MRILACLFLMLPVLGLGTAGRAGDQAGQFDYWILSLSWSPAWCAAQEAVGQDGGAQCAQGAGRGLVVHGLWPQYERGWPQDCPTDAAPPSRRDSAGMADLMGSSSLAFYQWRKHGSCSGLSGRDYYALTQEAADRVAIPPVLSAIDRPLRVSVEVIEDAFIEVNPGLTRDGITITCKAGALAEARICLTRDLQLRACAPDAAQDCLQVAIDLIPLR